MWKLIITNIMIIVAAFISYWIKWEGFNETFINLRTLAFVVLIIFAGLSIFVGTSEIKKGNKKIKDLQDISKIPTRNDLGGILKKHREDNYHKMYKRLPYIYASLEDKFKVMPSAEKKDPNIITATITSLFLSEGSDDAEPIFFKDKMSPRPGISLYVWVEKCYEDVKVSNFSDIDSDIDKINTRIGKFVYDSIYDKVLTYLKFVEEAESTPSHGKNSYDKPNGDIEKMFIATALKEIYLEKLPQTFDFQMLDCFDEERKKRLSEGL